MVSATPLPSMADNVRKVLADPRNVAFRRHLVEMLSQPRNAGRFPVRVVPALVSSQCEGCGAPVTGPECDYCRRRH